VIDSSSFLNEIPAPPCLRSADDPAQYAHLSESTKAKMAAWIKAALTYSDRPGRASSYLLKHAFQEDTGGEYVVNGAFKGAMMVAGFYPIEHEEQNWRFYYATDRCPRQRRRRGYGRGCDGCPIGYCIL